MTDRDRWSAHWPPFWQPALRRREIWRTLIGVVIVLAVEIAFLFWLASAANPVTRSVAQTLAAAGIPYQAIATATSFAGFLGLHLGLIFVAHILHARRYGSLFGPDARLLGRHFGRGVAVALAVGVTLLPLTLLEALVLPAGTVPPILPNLALGPWLLFLVPGLLLIFFQILAEEALFRGYLLQQLRARFRSPVAWALVPSLVFGALHFAPGTYGWVNAGAYAANAAVMALMGVFLTLRTGNLGAAAGVHFGNNATMVVLGMAGPLDGFSLLTIAMDPKSGYTLYTLAVQTLAMVAVFWLWWRWMDRHRPIANSVG